MRQNDGGTKVKAGFYFNRNEWDVTVISGEGGVLPGEPNLKYVRIPALALFLLAPVMGGLYVLFLPFIGFAMLFDHLGRKAAHGLRKLALSVASAVSPAWRPGEAYFAGKGKGEEKPKPGTKEPDAVDDLKKEIDKKESSER